MELWLNKFIPTQAILMVTHNIEEAVLLADRIVVMGKEPGHVVTEFSITLHQPRHRKDTAFQALVDKVYAAVAGQVEPQTLGTRPVSLARLYRCLGRVSVPWPVWSNE